MKRIQILSAVLGCIIAGCTLGPKTATLSGNIKFDGHAPAEKVYVGLYPETFEYTEQVGEPIEFLELTVPEFTLQLKPGRYGMVVWAFPFEKYQTNILILEAAEDIHFNITLPHYGMRDEFDGYYVVGDFNNWNGVGNLPLEKQGDKWILPDTSRLNLGSAYKFISGDNGFLDLSNKETVLVKDWATFNNIYHGGPVVLNPSLYSPEPKKATAEIQGGETTIRFNQLRRALDTYRDTQLMPVLRQMRNLSDEVKLASWKSLNATLDSLENTYPEFNQMILEQRLDYIRMLHPRSIKRFALQYQKAEESEIDAFYQSKLNIEYYQYYMDIADKIDPNSLLISGEFADVFVDFQSDLDEHPQIAELMKITPDHFDQKLMKIVQSGNDRIVPNICLSAGSVYSHTGQSERARTYLNKLKNDYPENRYIKEGIVDLILRSLDINIDKMAPDFSITTLSGESFKLSEQMGKFVMLDFWGSWCGPCRVEIPNFIKLYNSFSRDELVILGLANDDSTKLCQYIESENIPYPNALAGDELIKIYGISAYPTTLFIDPDGNICAKNLRGENIVDKVKEKMAEYQKNKNISS